MALKAEYAKIKVREYKWTDTDDDEVIYFEMSDGVSYTTNFFSIKDARKIIKQIEKAILKREQREAAAADKENN